MGCGHYSRVTLDSSIDGMNKKQYMNVKPMRDLVTSECYDLNFKIESKEEFDELCKVVIEKMKNIGFFQDDDLIECCYQICSTELFKFINTIENYENDGEIIMKLGAEYSGIDQEKIKNIFVSELGSRLNIALMEFTSRNKFFTRGMINLVRFSEIYASCEYNTLVLIIDEEQLYCQNTMIAIKYMLRKLVLIRNFAIIVHNEDEIDYQTNCYVSKIFQALELQRNIEHFTFLRFYESHLNIKAEELENLIDSVSNLQLRSMAIINLNFMKISRRSFMQRLITNGNLVMLGLQFDFTEDELRLMIVPLLREMPNLRLLILGFQGCYNSEIDYGSKIKKNLPSLEVFQTQYFEKN